MISDAIAKIGAGPKTAKDLTYEEAKQVMRAHIEGRVTPAQLGALLLAMRMKVESISELAGFTAAARECVAPLAVSPRLMVVDVPTYSGKQDTFHALAGAGILAAAAGTTVLLHGYEDVPGRITTSTILAGLGIPVDHDAQRASESLAAKAFAYLDISLYHPPLARGLDLRGELGVRTLFHPVAKLLNPARASSQVIGITHPPYMEKMIEALKMLGGRRAMIIRGVEGEPELSFAVQTRLLELKEDRVWPLNLQAKDVGLGGGTSQSMAACPPDQEVALLRRILLGELRGGPRDWVVMNAAMLLYAGGKAVSISAALPLARHAIDSGSAAQKLAELATANQAAHA